MGIGCFRKPVTLTYFEGQLRPIFNNLHLVNAIKIESYELDVSNLQEICNPDRARLLSKTGDLDLFSRSTLSIFRYYANNILLI